MSEEKNNSLNIPGILYRILDEAGDLTPDALAHTRADQSPIQANEVALGQVPEGLMRLFALGKQKAIKARDLRVSAIVSFSNGDEDACREALDTAWRLEMEKNYAIDIAWRELHIQCGTWRSLHTEVFIRQNDVFVIVPSKDGTPSTPPKGNMH